MKIMENSQRRHKMVVSGQLHLQAAERNLGTHWIEFPKGPDSVENRKIPAPVGYQTQIPGLSA
jgi:hypothetical protein